MESELNKLRLDNYKLKQALYLFVGIENIQEAHEMIKLVLAQSDGENKTICLIGLTTLIDCD